MIRRIIALLLSLCMLLSVVPVMAESEPGVSLIGQSALPGEEVVVNLDLKDCGGFVNLGFEISYDSSVMRLVAVNENTAVGAVCTTAQDITKNPYNIGWDSMGNVHFNGTLASFTFLISEDAPLGDYNVDIDYYKGRNGDYTDGISVNYDENDNPLKLKYRGGFVKVTDTEAPPGDEGDSEDETPSIGVKAALSSVRGYAGEAVDVTLTLSDNPGFVNLGFEISYDTSVLTLVKASENKNVGALFTSAENINKKPYNVVWDSVSDVCYNGNLLTFTFRIAENATPGIYPVTLSHYKGRSGDYIDGKDVNYNEKYIPIKPQYTDGGIEVSYAPISRPEATAENTYNGNTYMVFDRMMSWQEAYKACEEAGGHLASVTSAKENDFVQSLCDVGTASKYYLGAVDRFHSGIWSWETGESFVFSNWSRGEPSTQSYLAMNKKNGRWYAVEGNVVEDIGFVCEWEGELGGKDSTYWVEFVSDKTVYAMGESFDVSAWLYTDDSVIRIYDYTVSGFDSSRAGVCNVTVSYGEYSRSFEVEIAENKEVEEIKTYVVQAEASNGATISPSGYSEVKDGTVIKFVLGAKEGYVLDRVFVNGEAVKLTDSNLSVTVNSNTVIEVYGKKKTYTITNKTDGNGYIKLPLGTVEYGSYSTARIVANDGYIVSDVLVDGKSVGACNLYTFANIRENHSIEAVFEKLVQTVTLRATAGFGGRVSPTRCEINEGGSVKFTLTPDYGYHAAYAVVGSETVGISANEISLDNVTENTNITVVFEKNEYTVSVNEAEGARVSVVHDGQSADMLSVPYREVADIMVEVEYGYKLNMLYVNGIPVKTTRVGEKLVYSAVISQNTVVTARCGLTRESEYNNMVALCGVAADVNASNAYSKRKEFTQLADKYAELSEEEKTVCTSAYATVLATLDRANAYIALEESQIAEKITMLPDELIEEEYNHDIKEEIDTAYTLYEKLSTLSKSFIDYTLVSKLLRLKENAEELDRARIGAIMYLYELIDSVPDEVYDKDSLAVAYSKLLLAENTYSSMSEQEKNDVSEDMYRELISKHGKIATQIQKLYVTPFTGKVLRSSGVDATDTVTDAEAKRVAIYELMNEYNAFASFVKENISGVVIERLNTLYESASIKVSATVNNVPVDMNGDFDEDVELVLTQPDTEATENAISSDKALYQAIDVKMYSGDTEIQPSSKIRIKMEISKELAGADVSVAYINDEGVLYDVQGEVIEENGRFYIVFFIDHFSSFAILYSQENAPETKLDFDRDYANIGDTVTATVTGAINTSDCKLYMAGYSSSGEVTFVKIGEAGAVSATIAEKTETVKAMLWDKNMTPIVEGKTMSVFNAKAESSYIAVNFDRDYANIGDAVTATVTGAINTSDCKLYMAGYSSSGEVTFVKMGEAGAVSATIAEKTEKIKAMLWDNDMTPISNSEILNVSGLLTD